MNDCCAFNWNGQGDLLRTALSFKQKKPYTKRCALQECKGRAPLQRVFKFPSNIHVTKLWRKACGFPPSVDITNKRVCEKHFPKELLIGKYLPKTTVPTLNLPTTCADDTFNEEQEDNNDDNNENNKYSSDEILLTDYKLDLFDDVDSSEIEIYKSFVSTVKTVLSSKSHCTTCDIHIGTAPINEAIIKMHPLLRVTLCKKCFTFYNTGGFESGEDGSELYCRWCGQGGELYCCSSCPYVFCHNCISLNFPKKMVTEIQNVDDWKCFVCNPVCIMKLRAEHWGLLNFIEQQKLDVLNVSTDEVEINNRMSEDVSKCCNNRIKRLVIKRKPDNTADIPVPEPKKKALKASTSSERVDERSKPQELENPMDISIDPKIIEPEVNISVEQDRDEGLIKAHEPTVILTEPDAILPRPVATVRPSGPKEKNPPKILNNLLARKAEAKNLSQTNSSNSSSAQPIRILPNIAPVPSLVPSGLMLTPTSTSNIVLQRQPNPVYHTVNGFCIDLNSAAQQDMYRLPNGKIIQVRRQAAVGHSQIVQPQVQTQPQLQMIQPSFQPPQFIGNYQQLQPMGATIVQQLVPPQNQTNAVNKVPPLALRPVHGNLSVESSHVQLGQNVSNTVQIYQHMNTKIKTFTNSTAYKTVNTLTDVKDLTMHLTYLLNYSIGRLQSIRKECANNMKIIETELSKQNTIDGDECEIVETKATPVINLDSDDEADPVPSNSTTNTNSYRTNAISESVEVPSLVPVQPAPVVQSPPIPHFNIRNKTLTQPKWRPKVANTPHQNILAKYTKMADSGRSSGEILIRKIKVEPKSYMKMNKTGAKIVKF